MKDFDQLFDTHQRDKEALIHLYVMVINEKSRYQYDPKRLILDLLPDKKMLYAVYLPKREFSISQSVEEYGKHEIAEHRFINFLKFTEFSIEEINLVFDHHRKLMNTVDIPEKYQYTKGELYSFISNLRPPVNNRASKNELLNEGNTVVANKLTAEEIDLLYSK